MSDPKNTRDLIRQNEKIAKKPQKHDANLQKNSTLYFQIGLIVCLLMAYGLFEMKFESDSPSEFVYADPDSSIPEIAIDNIKVYEKQDVEAKPKQQPEKKALLTNEPEIVEDIYEGDVTDVITPDEHVTNNIITPGAVKVLDDPGETVEIPLDKIEVVPIYPGCEKQKTNEQRRKCMSDKISKLVKRKFNLDMSDLGLSGKQVIQTQFKIDKTGHVVDIKTRAPHAELEKEALRVIQKIPDMVPGKQRDKNVSVIYNLPIVFSVNN